MLRSGWMASVCALLVASVAPGAEPAPVRETPRTAVLDGVSLGMSVPEFQSALVARGYIESDERRRAFLDDSGAVRRRMGYREVPGLAGPMVNEIDHILLYPQDGFDAEAQERRIRERFGEPAFVRDGPGRLEMTFLDDPEAPELGEVQDACTAELRQLRPDWPETLAEARSHAAVQYSPENRKVEVVCPGTTGLYERFARNVEAPRMQVIIWHQAARVDYRLRWALLATPWRGVPGAREEPRGANATWID